MERNHAIAATSAAALLIVGTLAGRSLGQGDSAAASSYSQAATDQRVSVLEAEKKVLLGKLHTALKDREALAKQLGDAGPSLDVGGAAGTALKEYEALKAKLATAEATAAAAVANAEAAVADGKRLLGKAQADAQAQAQKLQQDIQKLREENRKLRNDVQSLGAKIDTLNTTIKGLQGFKNPFGR
jgi:chromosome segregation ATPase